MQQVHEVLDVELPNPRWSVGRVRCYGQDVGSHWEEAIRQRRYRCGVGQEPDDCYSLRVHCWLPEAESELRSIFVQLQQFCYTVRVTTTRVICFAHALSTKKSFRIRLRWLVPHSAK